MAKTTATKATAATVTRVDTILLRLQARLEGLSKRLDAVDKVDLSIGNAAW